MIRWRQRRRAGLLVTALVTSACSGPRADTGAAPPATAGTTPAVTSVYPGARWEDAAPETAGLDPAPLAAVASELDGTDTDCVVVEKRGRIVYEHTWNGFDPDKDQVVWSVSKSLTSLLIGIAAEEGRLSVEQPAADFVTEWKGTPAAAVKVVDLLSMDSGRYADHQTDWVTLPFEAPDQTAFAIGLPQQYPPGTHWAYNNAAVQVLDRVIERATGEPTVDYAQRQLFAPLGIEATWLRDRAGHPWTYGGATMSCRDLARIGHLMLNGGRWRDRQVVPEHWVRRSVRPSQELRRDYGYLWWLNVPVPPSDDQAELGAPIAELAENVYYARGLFGQYIAVIPDDGTVVVRTGRAEAGRDRFATTYDLFAALLHRVTLAERGRPG